MELITLFGVMLLVNVVTYLRFKYYTMMTKKELFFSIISLNFTIIYFYINGFDVYSFLLIMFVVLFVFIRFLK